LTVGSAVASMGVVARRGFGFVDRRFFGAWSRCPCAVATDLGRCLLTAWVETPGQVTKLLFRMACSHVEETGLKHDAWRY
jgi:hypothetical protein